MGWVKYTAPLAEGTRPTAPQMAELVAAFHERAQCGLVNANGAGPWGVTADQATLAATNLETACIYWTGTASSSASAAQMLDAAITAIAGYFVAPGAGWTGGSVLTQAASDIGVTWATAQSLMQAGLLNADYYNVCRHALQLLTAVVATSGTLVNYQRDGEGDTPPNGTWNAFKTAIQGAAEVTPGSDGEGIADNTYAGVAIGRSSAEPLTGNEGWDGFMVRLVNPLAVPNLPCFTAGYEVGFSVDVTNGGSGPILTLTPVNYNVGTGGGMATATVTPAGGTNAITVPGATAVGAAVPLEIRPAAYDTGMAGSAALDSYEVTTDGQEFTMFLGYTAFVPITLTPTFSYP
jgi:hypothetical protein